MGGCGSSAIKVPNEKRYRRAIKLYEVDEVKLLTNLINRDKCFDSGESPLTLACQEGHEAIVQALVTNGADVNKQDRHGRAPLNISVQLNDEDTTQILLGANASPNRYDGCNLTPLHVACEKGYTALVRRLLVAGACPNEHKRALPPLVQAVVHSHGECVDVLLRHGADPNVLDARGNTLLHVAVTNSDVLSTRLLLEYKADPSVLSRTDDSLVVLAALTACPGTLKVLLDAGLPHSAHKPDEPPPVIAAVAVENVECLDHLVDAGADLDVMDKRGQSALLVAMSSVVELERDQFYCKYFSHVYRQYSRYDPGQLSPEAAVKCVMSLVQAGAPLNKVWDRFAAFFPKLTSISFEQMVLCEVLIQSYGFAALPGLKVREFIAALIRIREHGLVRLIYTAGVDPCWEDESLLGLSQDAEDREVYAWVKRLRTTPRTLKDRCRQAIRRLLSPNVLAAVEPLPVLTQEVKDYVCIMDTEHYSNVP